MSGWPVWRSARKGVGGILNGSILTRNPCFVEYKVTQIAVHMRHQKWQKHGKIGVLEAFVIDLLAEPWLSINDHR